MSRFGAVSLVLLGCAAATPEPDPLAFLQVGVDPSAEATAIRANLERAGFDAFDRRDGSTFVLLLARRERDGACRLRLVTWRGTVFGADAPDARDPERIGLSIPPDAIADLDGDAEPEVAIAIEKPDRRCFGLLRVTEEGAAGEIPLPLDAAGPDACVESIADVAGDRRPELVVVARVEVPGLPAPATLARVLAGRDGRFEELDAGATERFHVSTRERIELTLADTPTGGERVRLALELAWLELVRGASEEDAVARFDRAVGMPDEPAIERARDVLRALARATPE